MAQDAVALLTGHDRAAALLDPIRLRILERLREPDSAAGVARELGLPRQRVGYHVRELERHGLLRHCGDRRKGNCTERVLQTTARHYLIAPETLGTLGLTPDQVRDRLSSAYLIAVSARSARDVAELQTRARAAGRRLSTLTIESEVTFATPDAQRGFTTGLAAAIRELTARYHDPTSPAGRRFRFVVAGYPAPAQPPPAPAGGPATTGARRAQPRGPRRRRNP